MELDQGHLWKHTLPRVAASAAELAEAEEALGVALSPSYRDFLAHANGWAHFYQWVDLFGVPELLSPRAAAATQRLNDMKVLLASSLQVHPQHLLPIGLTDPAMSYGEPNLFALVKEERASAGRVAWLSSDVVDVFDSFIEFFLAMVEYNRREAEDLLRESETQAGPK